MTISVEYIKEKITEALNIKIDPDCNPITQAINAEYALGRYHAFIDILQDLDLDAFCEVHEETSERRKELMQIVDGLYR